MLVRTGIIAIFFLSFRTAALIPDIEFLSPGLTGLLFSSTGPGLRGGWKG